jgi:hypothetical protein
LEVFLVKVTKLLDEEVSIVHFVVRGVMAAFIVFAVTALHLVRGPIGVTVFFAPILRSTGIFMLAGFGFSLAVAI